MSPHPSQLCYTRPRAAGMQPVPRSCTTSRVGTLVLIPLMGFIGRTDLTKPLQTSSEQDEAPLNHSSTHTSPEVCSQTRSLPLQKTSQSPNKTSGRSRRRSRAAGCCLSKQLPTRRAAGAPTAWKGPGYQQHVGSRLSCLQETAASQRRNWQPVLLIE